MIDSPHRYLRLGLQAGHDRNLILRAVAEASRTEAAGLTSVLTLNHLAWQTGASYLYLRRIVQRQTDPYSDILRRRRDGTEMRHISAPDPPLMSVQRWLLRNIVNKLAVHSASSAYMPGDSITRCARLHLGASWLIKMDVHNFFHSIAEPQVFEVFSRAGYNRLVAFELARLCTRENLGLRVNKRVDSYIISSYGSPTLGVLPQGAPTSGALANVIMYPCDEVLGQLARSHNLVYTRYADDITFSSSKRFSRTEVGAIIKSAGETLREHGLRPHKGKTRVSPPGSRHVVLGLLVDGDSLRLGRGVRQQVADHIRGVTKFGLSEHSRHRGFVSLFGFVTHVDGLLAFALDVDPVYASRKRAEWHAALRGQKWPVSAEVRKGAGPLEGVPRTGT
jgi:RNA-directed DNA polymerase